MGTTGDEKVKLPRGIYLSRQHVWRICLRCMSPSPVGFCWHFLQQSSVSEWHVAGLHWKPQCHPSSSHSRVPSDSIAVIPAIPRRQWRKWLSLKIAEEEVTWRSCASKISCCRCVLANRGSSPIQEFFILKCFHYYYYYYLLFLVTA